MVQRIRSVKAPVAQPKSDSNKSRGDHNATDVKASGQRGANARKVPAVRRASAILWLLAKNESSMTLTQIARASGIIPSTCLHILRELTSASLTYYDSEHKVYRLGQGIVDLAQVVIHYDNFADLARPHLYKIASKFGFTAMATSKIDTEHMACIAFVTPPVAASVNVVLGGRVPTFSGATGRCVAAFSTASKTQLKKTFSRIRWQTPITFEQWLKQIESTKISGYGEDEGYFTKGVTMIAVPLDPASQNIHNTIGIIAISEQFDKSKKAEIVNLLTSAAAEITSCMTS